MALENATKIIQHRQNEHDNTLGVYLEDTVITVEHSGRIQ